MQYTESGIVVRSMLPGAKAEGGRGRGGGGGGVGFVLVFLCL